MQAPLQVLSVPPASAVATISTVLPWSKSAVQPAVLQDMPTGTLVTVPLPVTDAVRVWLTMKLVNEVDLAPAVITEIGPLVAAAGTVAVTLVAVAAVTVAFTPLKMTVFSAATALKLTPLITTELPVLPLAGAKLVMAGGTVEPMMTPSVTLSARTLKPVTPKIQAGLAAVTLT